MNTADKITINTYAMTLASPAMLACALATSRLRFIASESKDLETRELAQKTLREIKELIGENCHDD